MHARTGQIFFLALRPNVSNKTKAIHYRVAFVASNHYLCLMLDRFLTYIRAERRYSDATAAAYERDIRRFLQFLEIDELAFDPRLTTSDDIRQWIITLTESGLSAASVNRMVSSLRALFRWLRKTGTVEGDPFLRIGQQRTPSKLPSYIPEAQMRSLIEQPAADSFESERNALIITLFYATGMRLAELGGVRRSDFSEGYAELHIVGKGNKERVIPIIEYARARVREHIERIKAENICTAADNFLFLTHGGGALSRSALYRIVRAELAAAGVQGKRSPHVLRHTFATHMRTGPICARYRRCWAIRRWPRHRSTHTTASHG